MAFKAVIFDFGGVFTTSPVENFAAFEIDHGLPERFIGGVIKTGLHDGAFARYERAEISREEFNFAFAEETRDAGFEINGETLLSLLSLELYPEMVEALRRIKSEKFKTGCITNNMASHGPAAMMADARALAAITDVFSLFDHVIESSKAGVRKPEPKIYEMMCDALRVTPEECVFIDDLGVNLKPARAMGMATVKAPIGNVAPAINELYCLLEIAP